MNMNKFTMLKMINLLMKNDKLIWTNEFIDR
jgi:hypothetical protein